MYYVYLIQNNLSKDKYIGYTTNLKRRLIEHNKNKTESTFRKKGEWVYVYVEIYRSEKDARIREQKLKHHGSSKQQLFKRIKESLL